MSNILSGVLAMYLGSILLFLIRTAIVIDVKNFNLITLWFENRIRWGFIFAILGVLNLILVIEGRGILEAISQFGMLINLSSNAAIGFLITAGIIRFQHKDSEAVQ